MWKIMTITSAVLSLAGCSNDNQIVIENNAMETITFNFRAEEKQVASGSTTTIPDIPNGTYTATLGTVIPSGTSSWTITPASGEFAFEKKSTKIRATFASTFTGGVYAVTWNYSSTDPISSSTPTSP
jgi:hypothetical protein